MAPRKPRGRLGQFVKTIDTETLEKIAAPPEDLGEEAQILWYRIWASGNGWLTPADFSTVVEICEIFEDKQFYRSAVKTTPRVYRMTNGAVAKHPYVEMLQATRRDFSSLLGSIGFNPRDRANISAIESLVDDPIQDLVRRKNEREAARREARGDG